MSKLYLLIGVFIIFFSFSSCNSETVIDPMPPTLDKDSMAYVINGADITTIANSDFKAAIIDYSKDGTEEGKYTINQLNQLKNNNVMPIAYLSIGEAEDYRFYWQDSWDNNPPSWLGEENPNWEGNYNVKFWDPEWQDIIYDYIDKILEQGFSGMMLDRVDSYYYWSYEKGELTKSVAAERMISFVTEIGDYIRNEKGYEDFKIISQNALGLFNYDNRDKLKKTICGVSIETLFYRNDGTETNELERVYRLDILERLQKYGKMVFVTDYVYQINSLPETFINKARGHGFIPYAAHHSRLLDELIVIPGLQPGTSK